MTQAFDDYAAKRPKPTLPARQRRKPIETAFIAMQAEEKRGNVVVRNLLAKRIKRYAVPRLPVDTAGNS